MKKLIVLGLFVLCGIAACGNGNASFGWREVKPPPGCLPKQIANSGGNLGSITILCEDRRIFN